MTCNCARPVPRNIRQADGESSIRGADFIQQRGESSPIVSAIPVRLRAIRRLLFSRTLDRLGPF
jgi:hypothetical protein